jgi:hypothetical protein
VGQLRGGAHPSRMFVFAGLLVFALVALDVRDLLNRPRA